MTEDVAQVLVAVPRRKQTSRRISERGKKNSGRKKKKLIN